MHKSGHCNVVNTFLMKQIGIKSSQADPPGGVLGRDKQGEINGQLFDSANDFLAGKYGVRPGEHGPNIHMPDTPDNLQSIIEIGQKITLAAGITTVNDVQVTKQEMESYLNARDSGKLKLRISPSFPSNYLDEIKRLGFCSSFGDD